MRERLGPPCNSSPLRDNGAGSAPLWWRASETTAVEAGRDSCSWSTEPAVTFQRQKTLQKKINQYTSVKPVEKEHLASQTLVSQMLSSEDSQPKPNPDG